MSKKTKSESPTAGQWPKLAVKNFGPIAEGEVELRPLTVFAGPSNTGKSWLATLIYALARHNNEVYRFPGLGSPLGFRIFEPDESKLKDFPEDPSRWLQSLNNDERLRLTEREQQALKSFLESGQEKLKHELLRCFGLAEVRNLVRERMARGASVTFKDATNLMVSQERMTIAENFSLEVDITKNEIQPPASKRVKYLDKQIDANLSDSLFGSLYSFRSADVFDLLAGNRSLNASAHYLPADRGGVMHAHRVVVGALIQGATHGGLTRRSPLPTLSGVLGDFLEQLIALAGHRHRLPQISSAELADRLEREVLGGRIEIKKSDVDYPHFTYRPDKWERDLSLMSVSSMVSELAPVALYLRHYVEEGDLLILEEPEAHLHPAMQRSLVCEIARWVRHGIRVLITTHSEWVLEEIANLVAAAEGNKKNSLKEQDVGMWLFESKDKKTPVSIIRKLKWNMDDGGYASDFDEVAMDMHNEWAKLVGGKSE